MEKGFLGIGELVTNSEIGAALIDAGALIIGYHYFLEPSLNKASEWWNQGPQGGKKKEEAT